MRPAGAVAPRPARPGTAGGRPVAPPRIGGEPGSVDGDVPGAVGRVLRDYLDDRLAHARAADETFARDVAERVAGFTLSGGKRWRSSFAWWAWRACGGLERGRAAAATLRVAAALELIQTCALVHDDVMDGSETRRGAPALHAAFAARHVGAELRGCPAEFGRAAAILAGDLALSWADDLVAEVELAPGLCHDVRRVWRDLRTEMVAGQYLDLLAPATASLSVTRALRIARLKSARYTVERPLALGATLAGADEATIAALRGAGRCAGIAFQLRDDLRGAFGDPAETGKPSGDDLRAGKLTYLVAVAKSRAEAAGDTAALAVLWDGLGRPELGDRELERVRAVLETTGARAQVEDRITLLLGRARQRLAETNVNPEARRRLDALLHRAAGLPTPPPALPAEPATPRPAAPRQTLSSASGGVGCAAPQPGPDAPRPASSSASAEAGPAPELGDRVAAGRRALAAESGEGWVSAAQPAPPAGFGGAANPGVAPGMTPPPDRGDGPSGPREPAAEPRKGRSDASAPRRRAAGEEGDDPGRAGASPAPPGPEVRRVPSGRSEPGRASDGAAPGGGGSTVDGARRRSAAGVPAEERTAGAQEPANPWWRSRRDRDPIGPLTSASEPGDAHPVPETPGRSDGTSRALRGPGEGDDAGKAGA
ncbi:polyprenyl synthetase family protein [Streptomyces sp. B6B3]|uniref:polyprenyl synthetase family protein n=1 Tax=Streptomyces sp. B6B3 TaxID=3153570 RepID=UPI00325F4872